MPIEVACRCGQRYAAEDRLAGQSLACPACGSAIAVPGGRIPVQPALNNQPPLGTIRCQFCHEYIPEGMYDAHVSQHLALGEDGQQNDYATLPPEMLDMSSDEFEDAPRWYRHEKCGEVTGMPEEIIATYLRDPWFYLSDKTFCTGCGKHVPLRECVWEETEEDLQTYTDRLRATKPEMRPGIVKRMFAAVLNKLF